MKHPIFVLLLLCSLPVFAQDNWPRQMPVAGGGKIIIYQPQPESLEGDKVHARAAVSVTQNASAEPVFGVIWCDAWLETDKNSRTAALTNIKVTDAKFPEDKADDAQIAKLKALLEKEVPGWHIVISLDELTTTLQQEVQDKDAPLNNAPPDIIYRDGPSLLVVLDGSPVIKDDKQVKMKRVMNSPFLIVEDGKKYYLYAGKYWYASSEVLSGWTYVSSLPSKIRQLDEQMKKQQASAQQGTTDKDQGFSSPPAIIVATKPTELIQSKGAATYAVVQGTDLLYCNNSNDDIFRDVNSQKVYVLLGGRWFSAASLNGPWEYVAADKLPAEFAKIPEGSPKDGVLSSVAGTDAAKEAVMDAQIPQTAKVDRKKATTTVTYDGAPKFEPIEGTSLSVAVNTSTTVLKDATGYYAVENGVWFQSANPTGPWAPATERPKDVSKIPPSNQAYNVKYVYIYDSTPEYVYMGYTPGYTGCYVYGPTLVYGTGYPYVPWIGTMYYPRPVTWGFGMHYNPWTGFSFSIGFSTGIFSFGMTFGGFGGWWGPAYYRPPYRPFYGPMYGRGPVVIDNRHINNININNNLYNRQNNVVTRDVNRGALGNRGGGVQNPNLANRPGAGGGGIQNRPGAGGGGVRNPNLTREAPRANVPNNVFGDRDGNVFQRDNNGGWNQRQNHSWQPASQNHQAQMNRDWQSRNRSFNRSQTSRQFNRGGGGGGRFRR
ncbi:carbohydrate-binding family V/XII [Chitinophaga barathri]|uniref:Carbohydrate-binding family V/XII n=1 Tax=Chitinophaga barathri TaxID=1647451 RepID=A0A3N4MJA7_9BACT|nr:carbohydrate-binding family V/XII [Chitinophaga barathri]RPD39759.1 carbohydrate-binding family V/XII [Chitinophaga barathri]